MPPYMSVGEAHRRVTDYLSRFADAVDDQDGAALGPLLAVSSATSPYLRSITDALPLFPDASRLVKQSDKYAQVAEIVLPLLRCLHSFRNGNLVEAYNAYEKSANAFLQEFRNWESAWALESVHTIAFEIRILAEKADRELDSIGKNPEKLKGAGSFFMKVFGALAGKGPKRVGALYVTCQLFKIYFKEFPVRDKVTYMYYTGRLEVYNENFLNADKKFAYALRHCNPQSEANIRMILKYLIPVKLSICILPKEWLLEKYNLLEYKDVVQLLKRGDLRLLLHALQEHEDRFLRSGVYLVLEKLELQVYQRLIKKIYIIKKQKDPSKAHQVRLEVIVKALKWLEMDIDVDEVECMMAILIYKNLMKGYFAHKSKVVVLGKQDPFPKLNGRPVNS